MKKQIAVFSAIAVLLSLNAEVFAQTRGPNYKPPGGGSSSSSSSSSTQQTRPQQPSGTTSSTPRGPNYNPGGGSSSSSSSTRPNTSSSSTQQPRPQQSGPSSSTAPRGPNYNPNPGSGSSSSTTVTRPTTTHTQPSYSSTGAPRGPRYNPNPGASTYSVPTHQTGRVTVNRPVVHTTYHVTYNTVRYHTYNDYYRVVNRRYIYRSWLQEPVIFTYYNGYWMIDSYPYYVHRGFRYRYHPVEMCNYQLVDSSGYVVSQSYGSKPCNISYDQCAMKRDQLNRNLYSDRYFCAENVGYSYANSNDYDYYGYATDLSYSQEAEIRHFLSGKSFLDLFYEGRDYRVGKCHIQSEGYSYVVKVSGYTYPDRDINSSSYSAQMVGCNVGSEAQNAGCILKAAIQEGYCL